MISSVTVGWEAHPTSNAFGVVGGVATPPYGGTVLISGSLKGSTNAIIYSFPLIFSANFHNLNPLRKVLLYLFYVYHHLSFV